MSLAARFKAAAAALAVLATVFVAGSTSADAAPANCSPWVPAGYGVSLSACAPILANGGIQTTVLVRNSGPARTVTVDSTLVYPPVLLWLSPSRTTSDTRLVPNTDGFGPSEFAVVNDSTGPGSYSARATAYFGLSWGTAYSPAAGL